MHAKGINTEYTSEHIEDRYNIRCQPKSISWLHYWQNTKYPFTIYYSVMQNNRVISNAVYIASGINVKDFRKIPGIWTGENEDRKFGLKMLTDF